MKKPTKSWFERHPHVRAAVASRQGQILIYLAAGVVVALIGAAVWGPDPVLDRIDKVSAWVAAQFSGSPLP